MCTYSAGPLHTPGAHTASWQVMARTLGHSHPTHEPGTSQAHKPVVFLGFSKGFFPPLKNC